MKIINENLPHDFVSAVDNTTLTKIDLILSRSIDMNGNTDDHTIDVDIENSKFTEISPEEAINLYNKAIADRASLDAKDYSTTEDPIYKHIFFIIDGHLQRFMLAYDKGAYYFTVGEDYMYYDEDSEEFSTDSRHMPFEHLAKVADKIYYFTPAEKDKELLKRRKANSDSPSNPLYTSKPYARDLLGNQYLAVRNKKYLKDENSRMIKKIKDLKNDIAKYLDIAENTINEKDRKFYIDLATEAKSNLQELENSRLKGLTDIGKADALQRNVDSFVKLRKPFLTYLDLKERIAFLKSEIKSDVYKLNSYKDRGSSNYTEKNKDNKKRASRDLEYYIGELNSVSKELEEYRNSGGPEESLRAIRNNLEELENKYVDTVLEYNKLINKTNESIETEYNILDHMDDKDDPRAWPWGSNAKKHK